MEKQDLAVKNVSDADDFLREEIWNNLYLPHLAFFRWRMGDALKKHVKAKKSFWKMGCLAAVSLIWLVIRTGSKPSRITYPCQKAAVANINIFLLVLFAPLLDFGRFKTALLHALNSRVTTTVLLVCSLLLAFGSVAFTGNYVPIESSFVPVPLDLQPHTAVSTTNSSNLFFVENASGADGIMNGAVSSLLQLMTDHGLFFFKTANQPSGLIGKNDVVIIKVNSEWNQRGGTNIDLVKSIVNEIVNHPEGFTGEVVIADNGQWTDRTDQSQWYTPANAYNQSQSMYNVANSFPAYKVSSWLWDIVRKIQVNEYSQGDNRDGYVVSSTTDPDTWIQVSYPKFRTKYGTYISLKNGIWTGSNYDSGRLKLINVPVLKSHESYGVSGCIKHYMGVLSNVAGFSNGHGLIGAGAMGTVMAETKFPTLNILDCIYVNANPVESGSPPCGPDTTYATASYTNVIGASQDPVALDYWAAKHILVPTAQAKGYTSYSSLDPDYAPVTSPLSESFHNYLERSMNELKKAGFRTTMNESQMNVYLPQKLVYWRFPDLNGDGTVNIQDISIVAKAFNCKKGDARWNPIADLDGNGIVNIVDMSIVAREYGRTMVTILKDGFESGTLDSWVTHASGVGSVPIVQSAIKYAGTYSAEFSLSSGAGGSIVVKDFGKTYPTLYCRIYVRFSATPTTSGDGLLIGPSLMDVKGCDVSCAVIMNDAGTLKWGLNYQTDTGGLRALDTTGESVATNTWYCVEVMATTGAGTGIVDLYVNGIKIIEVTGIGNSLHLLSELQLGDYTAGTLTVDEYVDNVVASETYIGPELGTPLQADNMLTASNNKNVIENNVGNNLRDISPDQSNNNRIYHSSSMNNAEFQSYLPTKAAITLGIKAALQAATTEVTSIGRPRTGTRWETCPIL